MMLGNATATAQAIRMLATELTTENMPRRGYPPVCILVSDGHCTDTTSATSYSVPIIFEALFSTAIASETNAWTSAVATFISCGAFPTAATQSPPNVA